MWDPKPLLPLGDLSENWGGEEEWERVGPSISILTLPLGFILSAEGRASLPVNPHSPASCPAILLSPQLSLQKTKAWPSLGVWSQKEWPWTAADPHPR